MVGMIYTKDLSGSVVQIYCTLFSDIEKSLEARPGYRLKLFRDNEELGKDATLVDGETLNVVYVPIEFDCYIKCYSGYTLTLNKEKERGYWDYSEITIDILDDYLEVHRLVFYENRYDSPRFIPSSSIKYIEKVPVDEEMMRLCNGIIDITPNEILHLVDDPVVFGDIDLMIDHVLPSEYDQSIRQDLADKIKKRWPKY